MFFKSDEFNTANFLSNRRFVIGFVINLTITEKVFLVCLTMRFIVCIIMIIKLKGDMMSIEMVRLNITLPSSITEELNQFSAPRKRSQFIAEAIMLRIKLLKEKKMEALLAEGYRARKNEGLEITKEFEPIDIKDLDEY
ncbi:MAG: hypothetical protein DRH93_20825 [Deltaproteobacteria bacterium]|nr:MAG: hypothetical protein DRH93_20825 [Deltaproteobacteria bacterium]